MNFMTYFLIDVNQTYFLDQDFYICIWHSSNYHFENMGELVYIPVSKGHQRYDEVKSLSKTEFGMDLNIFLKL